MIHIFHPFQVFNFKCLIMFVILKYKTFNKLKSLDSDLISALIHKSGQCGTDSSEKASNSNTG